MKALKEARWLKFCESLSKTKKYSADYWRKINQDDNPHFNNAHKAQIDDLINSSSSSFFHTCSDDTGFDSEFDMDDLSAYVNAEVQPINPPTYLP